MHGVRPVSRRLKNKTMHTTFELWQAAIEDPMLAPIMQGVNRQTSYLLLTSILLD